MDGQREWPLGLQHQLPAACTGHHSLWPSRCLSHVNSCGCLSLHPAALWTRACLLGLVSLRAPSAHRHCSGHTGLLAPPALTELLLALGFAYAVPSARHTLPSFPHSSFRAPSPLEVRSRTFPAIPVDQGCDSHQRLQPLRTVSSEGNKPHQLAAIRLQPLPTASPGELRMWKHRTLAPDSRGADQRNGFWEPRLSHLAFHGILSRASPRMSA